MSNHTSKCPADGSTYPVVWAEGFGWTGACDVCESIMQFVNNEEVSHE